MSMREIFPGDRGGEVTQDVASILAAITLPTIERFEFGNAALAGLPDVLVRPVPDPEPPTRASVARAVAASGVASLAAIRVLESELAACKAGVIDRVLGALAVESAALDLTGFQTGLAQTSCIAEIAAALCIPERTAAGLSAHAVDLPRHPRVKAALAAGALSWRHAVTVLNELSTLAETPSTTPEEAAVFEGRLLRLAEGCTASRFAAKARKARESMFPDSLDTRTNEAFRARRISNDPGRDGMNWIELHIPTVAANAIMVHCTRAARAIKADALERQRAADAAGTGQDCREYRTLEQLRADVASILLMGQELPAGARYTTPHPSETRNFTSSGLGGAGNSGTGGGHGANQSSGTTRDADASAGGSGWGADTAVPGGGSGVMTPAGQDIASVPGDGGRLGLGVGQVLFGEKSAFGVTLHDVEPVWAHAIPSTGDDPALTPDPALDGTTAQDGTAAAGWVNGLVDGIAEHPQREAQEQDAHLEQLAHLSRHPVLADPPMPKALVMVKVPVLGLLGITDEPAELDDTTAGPVPLGIARKLLAGSSTFLRVFTDPVSGEALPMKPDRYTLSDAERSVLQALAGGCYFPNCTNPVMDTDLDHVDAFETGGKTTMGNLRPACRKHHAMKHLKDDKDRNGNYRRFAEPWRTGMPLRGWTPKQCTDGSIGWISPSGTWHPPEYNEPQLPAYPKWFKKRLENALGKSPATGQGPAGAAATGPTDFTSPLEYRTIQYLRDHAA